VLVLLLLGAFAGPAAPALEASWDAPAGCPDREVLLARTRARIGATLQVPATIRGTVRATASGYALSLELAIAESTEVRQLDAPVCDELVDAAALIVAVALDPVFVISEAAEVIDVPEAPSVAPTPRRAAPPPTVEASQPRARPSMRTLGVALRPSVGAWFGALPNPAATVGFDLVFPARRSLRAELGVLAIPRERVRVATNAGANLWLATAVLRGCFAPAVGRVRPMGCVGIAAGAIGGQGNGSRVRARPASEPWISATAAAGLGIALSRRIELFARGEGHVHLVQPAFHLDSIGNVHEVGATSVTALAGLQAVLP
jgi:hypothetical protein